MTLQPTRLARDADGFPYSERYGDIYASRDGALGQAQHVFLNGTGLPQAWQGREQFVVLETGFGLGTNFLATWQAWRTDPQRPRRLHFVSVEKHPLASEDLPAAAPAELRELAEALARQWPLPLAGLHRLEFDDGGVSLTLALGDARTLVPQWVVGADVIFLDGFAPDRNPEMWEPALLRAIGRCARPGARLATYTAAAAVRGALAAAGFELETVPGYAGKRHMLVGRYVPRWRVRRHEPPPAVTGHRSVLVIGAGLAGSACADALSRRGWAVRVLERVTSASGASALPWGLVHPQLTGDESRLARLVRAGVHATHAALDRAAPLEDADTPTARGGGVFQMADDDATLLRWQEAIDRLGWPQQFVELLDVGTAAERVGLRPLRGGLWWPQGAMVSPSRWCRRLLANASVERCTVERLVAADDGWAAVDATGHVLATAPVIVVAAALASPGLLGLQEARVQPIRGRIAFLDPAPYAQLLAPISGDGYLLRDPDGGIAVGATYEVPLAGAPDSGDLSAARAMQSNLARVHRLLADPPPGLAIGSFDGVRCVARDRMPLAGAVADEAAVRAAGHSLRGAHLEDIPRLAGLYACFGLGSRGLTFAALLAELIAARIEGEPWPIERDLARAVDPARFLLARLRRGDTLQDARGDPISRD